MTAAVALLVALLAIQTYRLHQAQKDAAGTSRDRPASEATAAGREELARAGLLLEDPGHTGMGAAPADPMADYLVEALASFLDQDPLYDDAADSAPRRGSRAGKAATGGGEGDSAAAAAIKRAAAKARRAKRQNDEDAEDEAADGVAIDPRRSKQLYNQARKLIQRGSYEEAAAALQESIAADGSNASSYRTLGGLYRQLGMTAEEMQVYADWSAARPDDPLAHYYLANAYLRAGADADVLSELGQFQELSADNLGSYAMAASIYRRLGMPGRKRRCSKPGSTRCPSRLMPARRSRSITSAPASTMPHSRNTRPRSH